MEQHGEQHGEQHVPTNRKMLRKAASNGALAEYGVTGNSSNEDIRAALADKQIVLQNGQISGIVRFPPAKNFDAKKKALVRKPLGIISNAKEYAPTFAPNRPLSTESKTSSITTSTVSPKTRFLSLNESTTTAINDQNQVVQIIVKSPPSFTLTVDVHLSDTVEKVMKILSKKHPGSGKTDDPIFPGIPVKLQDLTYKNTALHMTQRTLFDYNIQQDSTLVVTVRQKDLPDNSAATITVEDFLLQNNSLKSLLFQNKVLADEMLDLREKLSKLNNESNTSMDDGQRSSLIDLIESKLQKKCSLFAKTNASIKNNKDDLKKMEIALSANMKKGPGITKSEFKKDLQDKWKCEDCFTVNGTNTLTCEMCDYEKPAHQRSVNELEFKHIIIGATLSIVDTRDKLEKCSSFPLAIVKVKEYIETGENAGKHKVVRSDDGSGNSVKYYFLRNDSLAYFHGSFSSMLTNNSMWNCCACTLENYKLLTSCVVCGTSKPLDVELNTHRNEFKVLSWENKTKHVLAFRLHLKKMAFNAFRDNIREQKERRQAAAAVLVRLFKVFYGSRQYKKKRAAFIMQKFAKVVLLKIRPKKIRAANIVKRFLIPPLLRKRRMREVRHQKLTMQRDLIVQCLEPPVNGLQQNAMGIGTHVRLRNKQTKGVIIASVNGGAKFSVQLVEEVRQFTASDLLVLPPGLQDISPVLTVSFEDLVDNNSDVLDRCEMSIQASMRVLKRRTQMVKMMMTELVEIWDDTLPSSRCLKTVFEKQAAHLFACSKKKMSPTQMDYFYEQSLLAINQLGNGFHIENFERIIQYWAEEWKIPPKNPCAICFDFFPAKDYFANQNNTLKNFIDTTDHYYPGDRVKCRYKSYKYKQYDGSIYSVNEDGTYVVHYDDGDIEERVPNEVGRDHLGKLTARLQLVKRKFVNSPIAESCKISSSRNVNYASCKNNSQACNLCVQQYCRAEMTGGVAPVLWDGVPCFCGCSAVITDEKIKSLWISLDDSSTQDSTKEYESLARQLRHRRVAADPYLRFCPNPECKSDALVTKIDLGSRRHSSVLNNQSGSNNANAIEEKENGDDNDDEDFCLMLNSPSKESKVTVRPVKKKNIAASPRIILNGVAVVDTKMNNCECWKCHESLCIKCGASSHSGSCTDNHDVRLDGMVSSKNDWVRCSKCTHVLERISGCDHMTCRCGAEFCFQCGSMPHCGVKCKKKANMSEE